MFHKLAPARLHRCELVNSHTPGTHEGATDNGSITRAQFDGLAPSIEMITEGCLHETIEHWKGGHIKFGIVNRKALYCPFTGKFGAYLKGNYAAGFDYWLTYPLTFV